MAEENQEEAEQPPEEAEPAAEAQEDPELTALKEEIASLEASVNTLKKTATDLEEDAEDYSEKGYLLKCAEMDNIRRLRDQANMNSRAVAKATVIQNFLPVLDELQSLKESFQGNEFASGYSALAWNLEQAFKDMDVEEISANVGDVLDRGRMRAVEERYDDEIAVDCVIEAVSTGFQMKGNVMRFADVVVSMGSEAEAIAAAEAQAREEAERMAQEEAERQEESGESAQ